ncbi:MAG: PQQ-dependent sugar dehydrogenase [Actinobacteria bacterium]|nr:PQQ-dependent sugar dehydrogenase [Actinomycetota bacterium]
MGRTMLRGRLPHLVCAVLAAPVLASCSSPVTPTTPAVSPSPSPTTDDPIIATDLEAPWSIVFYRGTALVSERDAGRIVEIGANRAVREVGRIEAAEAGGEGGLLGLTVHDSWLYAYYTTADDNRVERFELRGDPGSLSLGPGQVILDGLPSARNHNGGRIAFGPDQLLYVTVGDAGDRASAQDLDVLSGKILRLTPEGAVPADNPFSGSPVYSYGHRNPQGLAWDQQGTLYATEFGQDTWDELNVIEPGGNYGWPQVEGIAGGGGFIDPVQQWPPSEASPSGMTRADGTLYIANLRGERLREVPLSDPTVFSERFVDEPIGRLRDVALAPDGSLWVLTNNTDGRGSPNPGDDHILRIRP